MHQASQLKFFLIMLLCLFGQNIVAQEVILLQGKIEGDSLEGTSVHIINLTQETGTVNTPSGDFQIEVRINDTLYFSSINFKLLEVPINKEIFSRGYLEVKLKAGINVLQEVNISDIGLTGNIKSDLTSIPVFDQKAVGFPLPNRPEMTSIQRKLYSAGNSGALGLLVNTLTGRIKMLKEARGNEKLRMLVEKGINAVPHSIFVEEFMIPEEHVINFVYYCAEDDSKFKELVDKNVPFELIEYYKSKVTYFLESRME